MLHYKLHQDNRKTSKRKGFWYGRIVTRNTYNIEDLAQYMANHNTPFSKGTIKGILTDMVASIRELTLSGNPVKIDNLAIFSVGFNSLGVEKANDYSPKICITRYRLRARPTGLLSAKQLEKQIRIAEATDYKSPRTPQPSSPHNSGKKHSSEPSPGPEPGEDAHTTETH